MMNRRASLQLLAAIVSLPAGSSLRALAEGALAVVYPQVSEPYQAIFSQIVQGVRDAAAGQALIVRLGADVEASDLDSYLRQRGAMRVIALGRPAIKAAGVLNGDFKLVLGGALLSPSADTALASAITLAPEVDQLLLGLRQLAPEVRRIFTVFSRQHSGWLVDAARESARQRGFELIAAQAADLSAAAREYTRLMQSVVSKRDALWLPPDLNTVDDTLVLPLVLRSAWDKEIVLFSSSLSHVRKGALMALYPDNVGLGRQLAALAYAPTPGIVHPARSLKRAVNIRTAAHLGLTVRRTDYDAVFPEQ